MKSSRKLFQLLLVGLAVLVAFACSSGGGGNVLFPGAAALGLWSGTSSASTGAGGTSQTWNLAIDHTANTFSAQNVTAGKNYSGTVSIPPSLFTETTTTSSNDSSVPNGTVGHSIEVTDAVVLLHLDDAGPDVTPLVNTKGQCPTLSAPTTFNVIRYGWLSGWNSTTDTAYEVVTVTQSGSTFTPSTIGQFKLDGTPTPPGTSNPAICSNGVFTVPATDGPIAFSPTELIGLGGPGVSGTNHSMVIFPDPGISIAAVVAGQYTGMVFKSGPPQKVGFGPGAGSSITGGTWANIKTDAFNTHANNITINFSPGPSAGLLTGSVVDVNGTHSPMIVQVMTAKNAKFQILLLTTDGSPTQSYHIFLSQK